MQPSVQPVTKYVEWAIQIPGVGMIFLKGPEGMPPPVVTASATAIADSGLIPAKPPLPSIEVPEHIPAKTPCVVKINGSPRTVAACVAAVLSLIAEGAREVQLRPETHSKFALQVPEIKLVRVGKKVVENRAWFLVA
jgi:hypothetical protein